jgi:hypothetical protein
VFFGLFSPIVRHTELVEGDRSWMTNRQEPLIGARSDWPNAKHYASSAKNQRQKRSTGVSLFIQKGGQ